jgi:hypothetical protein
MLHNIPTQIKKRKHDKRMTGIDNAMTDKKSGRRIVDE